ncbi:MAG: ADP-forming succinate--CoA ligase subunit beta [Thermoprotei archaeon]|nr:MAG: ADP-forming succinate--CoA ligase subunit beta [Thermoprotei archaeon]
MNLYEYEGRLLFKKYGIPVSDSGLASSPKEAKEVAERINPPYVVKAQVLVGGRGRAGGIRFAKTPEEVEEAARRILGMTIRGVKVKKVLVAEKVDIEQELYVSFIINRGSRTIDLLVSPLGGTDIEEIVKERAESLLRQEIDPLLGLQEFMVRKAFKHMGLSKQLYGDFKVLVSSLYRLFVEYDCELAEINPLALTKDDELVAIDSKIIVDDNSLYRHPDLLELRKERVRSKSELERKAELYGLSYVELEGYIGILGNGAGLTMATMDLVSYYGGKPANFLDIGGGATRERVEKALSILLENNKVKVVFINILGGITRCDEVARGIISALEKYGAKPVVVRMIGTREEEGKRILENEGIHVLDSMEEAARIAVELAKG